MSEITIIGGGIGGLAMGLALQKTNIDCKILEASKQITAIGAGIILGPNATKILNDWGILNELIQAGNPIKRLNITDNKLKVLLSTKSKKQHSIQLAIHRGDLQKVLFEQIEKANIELSKKLTSINAENEGYDLIFENGTSSHSKIIIAADGIHSVVRNKVFKKNNERVANQKCWRAVCTFELPEKYQDELNEAWGKGKRFGFVKISASTIYWYALINHQLLKEAIDFTEVFGDFDPLVLQILEATEKEKIFESALVDLDPFSPWTKPNICLIGDAAHAILPNLGQGAAQAIVDAAILSEYIKEEKNTNIAFEKFSKKRTLKLKIIALMSRNMGKMAEIENPLGIKIRNLFFRMTPDFISQIQIKYIQE